MSCLLLARAVFYILEIKNTVLLSHFKWPMSIDIFLFHIVCKNIKNFYHILLLLNLPPKFYAKETFFCNLSALNVLNWSNFCNPSVCFSCLVENFSLARNPCWVLLVCIQGCAVQLCPFMDWFTTGGEIRRDSSSLPLSLIFNDRQHCWSGGTG